MAGKNRQEFGRVFGYLGNVADAAISMGVVFLLIGMWRAEDEPEPEAVDESVSELEIVGAESEEGSMEGEHTDDSESQEEASHEEDSEDEKGTKIEELENSNVPIST